MTITKIIRGILAVCFLIVILAILYIGGLGILKKDETKPAEQSVAEQTFDEATLDEDEETFVEEDDEAMWRQAPIFIDDIDPKTIKTTEKLHEVFDRFMLYSIPTVEIENLPSDFAKTGDADLFIKALLPIVMRENEKITDDRNFLITLAVKMKNNETWTPEETVRFEKLTRTYDTFTKKLPAGQLAELLDKVDNVPNSLVIAQAGIQTNWGKTNLKAPLGEKGWINSQYALKKFKTLPAAVHSFMREINSMPQYQNFRVQRRVYKNLRGSLSARLIDYMTPFEPEDASYIKRLKEAYRTYNLGPLDNALFWQ